MAYTQRITKIGMFNTFTNFVMQIHKVPAHKSTDVKTHLYVLKTHQSPHLFYIAFACMGAKLLQSCLTLCDTMDCSPPGSSIHEISQARTLEWVAIPFSRGSSRPRDGTYVSCIAGRFSND